MNRTIVLLIILGLAGGLLHAKRTFFPSRAQLAREAATLPVSALVPPAHTVRGPAVDVYGRDGCGYTRGMLADLQAAGVPVRYHDIDVPSVEAQFHARFQHEGVMRNGAYELPIVAVAGQSLARPGSDAVIYRFRAR
ncbi:glutaredoxin family protein [Stenotrophomonas sp. NPDC077464]|uniref:glutaredoxin family protein n=1 Tax=unclassified Stenotrophomonas TaxID=196198 RepID=UPI0037CFE53F